MEYTCHAFHPSLPGGRASGTCSVQEGVVAFQVKGQPEIRVSLGQLAAKSGGASQRLIFFSHPQIPEWSFYTSDRSILADPFLGASADIGRVFKQSRRRRLSGWSVIVAAMVLVVAIPVLLLLRMDLFSGAIAKQIPAAWEQSLGTSSLAQFRVGQEFMDEAQATALLKPLVTPLLNARLQQRYDYQFHIVHDPSLNAFALPGGQVVIHSGLIQKADSAEQLLGVLAHEMIHVEQQHGVRNVIGAAGIYVVVSALVGDVNGILAILSSATPVLLNQSYSRRFETEADTLGFDLLVAADIHPRGLAEFFGKMKQEEEKQKESVENEQAKAVIEAMEYLSTHPATERRVQNLNKRLARVDLGDEFINLSKEFATLKEAVNEFTGPAPEEAQHEN